MQTAQVFVSAVSIWEISIKYSAGKLAAIPSEVVVNALAAGFKLLPISSEHAVEVAKLPYKHRDPFDRMLIAQAMSESMILLTSDAALAAYGDVVAVV
jgi:PIN domain nuclease of toxin-antitoxin system